MKRIRLTQLSLCLIIIAACQKSPSVPEAPVVYWGTVGVNKNGVAWAASSSVSIHTKFENKLNISFIQFDKYGFKREKCGIFKIPAFAGTYPLHNTSIQVDDSLVGANFFYNDDDFLLGYYNVLEADSSSFVTIASYDTITKEVKGSFDIIFKVGQRPFPGAPDTIHMENGVFHTKVLK